MSNIIEDYPAGESMSTCWRGKIARAPSDEFDSVDVLIDAFDATHRFGPCRWNRLAEDRNYVYTPPDTAWRYVGQAGQPAFQNGWSNLDGAGGRSARFRKLSNGMVTVQGCVSGGTVGQPIFTLPVGYRPDSPYDHNYVALTAGVHGTIDVLYDGNIVISGSNTWAYLSSLMFFAGPDLELDFIDDVPLPQRGDPCVVVFDEQNRPYVIGWWPV